MKTKEFIEEVEELGYKITGTKYDMFINSRGAILVTVSKTKQYKIEIHSLFAKHADELLDLCVEYVKTPIEEREEEEREDEKKYCLRKIDRNFYEGLFLNYDKYNNRWFLGDCIGNTQYQTDFTCSEIEDIKKKFNTDLSEFTRSGV